MERLGPDHPLVVKETEFGKGFENVSVGVISITTTHGGYAYKSLMVCEIEKSHTAATVCFNAVNRAALRNRVINPIVHLFVAGNVPRPFDARLVVKLEGYAGKMDELVVQNRSRHDRRQLKLAVKSTPFLYAINLWAAEGRGSDTKQTTAYRSVLNLDLLHP